jgi:hypothetical protein
MSKDSVKNFDIRIVERKIQEGTVSRQEYEAYLGSLPDATANIDEEYCLSFSER